MPAETSEHLLYHLLSSAKHLELQAHIKPLLVEHCSSIARIAPNATKVTTSSMTSWAAAVAQEVGPLQNQQYNIDDVIFNWPILAT